MQRSTFGQAGAKLFDQGREIGFENQDARFGMVEDGGQLDGGEPHVERHHDGARQRDAEVAFQQLVVVEAEIGDAVAGLDALGEQSGGEPFAALAEFGSR